MFFISVACSSDSDDYFYEGTEFSKFCDSEMDMTFTQAYNPYNDG